MPENRKTFQCESCGAKEFDIIVEPRYPATEENEEWLNDVSICPACGAALEEV